jgi:hypothetical protein
MSATNLISFLPVSEQQARLVLGAMYSIAAAEDTPQPADLDALNATVRHILYAGNLQLAPGNQAQSAGGSVEGSL